MERGKDTGVEHISFNSWPKNDCEGFKAALERATRMFFDNLSFCEGNVVKYCVLEDRERELAKKFLAKVRTTWYEVHGSLISAMRESTTQG